MSDILQPFAHGGGRGAGGVHPRLTLAAFGRHPGWADQMPAFGIETQTLAFLKQALYDNGVRIQNESGAWDQLEENKRLEGFDHLLLWLRHGHVVLGEFWSSTDGKGRANYPMVICVDTEGMTPMFVWDRVGAGLDRLRNSCKAATRADEVVSQCRAAQEQLRMLAAEPETTSAETSPTLEARRQFLERHQFGSDKDGLLRVLHELAVFSARPAYPSHTETGFVARVPSRHLRLPLTTDTHSQGLLLWAAFLRCAVPETTPLLLISRRGAPWLDIIVSDPVAGDFFCLQASLSALPPTTNMPCELSTSLKAHYEQAEAKFLSVKTFQ
jgi:hypothetical protein